MEDGNGVDGKKFGMNDRIKSPGALSPPTIISTKTPLVLARSELWFTSHYKMEERLVRGGVTHPPHDRDLNSVEYPAAVPWAFGWPYDDVQQGSAGC